MPASTLVQTRMLRTDSCVSCWLSCWLCLCPFATPATCRCLRRLRPPPPPPPPPPPLPPPRQRNDAALRHQQLGLQQPHHPRRLGHRGWRVQAHGDSRADIQPRASGGARAYGGVRTVLHGGPQRDSAAVQLHGRHHRHALRPHIVRHFPGAVGGPAGAPRPRAAAARPQCEPCAPAAPCRPRLRGPDLDAVVGDAHGPLVRPAARVRGLARFGHQLGPHHPAQRLSAGALAQLAGGVPPRQHGRQPGVPGRRGGLAQHQHVCHALDGVELGALSRSGLHGHRRPVRVPGWQGAAACHLPPHVGVLRQERERGTHSHSHTQEYRQACR
jgi:hypothetical protein